MGSRKSEALAFSLVSGINHAMARLVDIWDSIGIMEDQRIERMQTVKKHIEDLLRDMITEEETLRHRIRTSIITTQKELETLCLEMSMDPYRLEEDLTVLQLEKNLRCQLETLQKEKNERLRELNDLRQQDEELCVTLCSTPYYIPSGSLPSQTQLQELKEHIKNLSVEKESRVKVFSGLREDIKNLMDEMGHEPETSLERDSVGSDTDIFLLTHENIQALKLLLSQWRNTVERLEVLQRARLEEVIDKVRQELVVLWDKCMFGPEQREPFNAHFCDNNYTEELLLLHDSELLKMKGVYEAARPLLEGVEKWERHWVLFQDFERKAADPNRFSNRGGALLKESKDRAKVQKLLPKLEEELKTHVEAWEKTQGSPFLLKGQRVMEYISKQWEEHRMQKDKEKNERMSKKADSSHFKTPTKRPHGQANSSVTPSKIRKTPSQAALRTPTMSSSSISSSVSTSNVSSTFLCVPGKPPLSAKQRTKTIETCPNPRTPLQESNSDKKPSSISYADFTNELSKKANHNAILNSTVKDML
uniref:Zgc:86764 n=1 Tax=Astyanax mexicanus TaxID=7994 RepID=A0A3B1IRR2_ASTMX